METDGMLKLFPTASEKQRPILVLSKVDLEGKNISYLLYKDIHTKSIPMKAVVPRVCLRKNNSTLNTIR